MNLTLRSEATIPFEVPAHGEKEYNVFVTRRAEGKMVQPLEMFYDCGNGLAQREWTVETREAN